MPVTGGTPASSRTERRDARRSGSAQSAVICRRPPISSLPSPAGRVSSTPPPCGARRATGGPPTEMARFTELQASGDGALHFHGVALAPEGLVLGSDWGVGKVVPLDGGSPWTLAVPAVGNVVTDVDFVAVDARGVYAWSARTRRGADALAEELVISPVDGGAVRPVWSTMPASSYVVQGWPDGAGGGLVRSAPSVSGIEQPPDDRLVDRRERGTRACSPAGLPARTPTSTTAPRRSLPTPSTSWPCWRIRRCSSSACRARRRSRSRTGPEVSLTAMVDADDDDGARARRRLEGAARAAGEHVASSGGALAGRRGGRRDGVREPARADADAPPGQGVDGPRLGARGERAGTAVGPHGIHHLSDGRRARRRRPPADRRRRCSSCATGPRSGARWPTIAACRWEVAHSTLPRAGAEAGADWPAPDRAGDARHGLNRCSVNRSKPSTVSSARNPRSRS